MSPEGSISHTKATLTLQTLKKMRLFHKKYLIQLLEFWLYLGKILQNMCVKHATFLLMREIALLRLKSYFERHSLDKGVA